MKYYVHLGLSKTGSSFLQRIIFDPSNALTLKQHGIFPLGSLVKPVEKWAGSSMHDIQTYRNLSIKQESLNAYARQSEKLAPENSHTILYTNEATGNIQDPVIAKRFIDSLNADKITVIIFVRRQDIRLQSAYAEAWMAIDRTKEAFLDRIWSNPDQFLHYSKRLNIWTELIGKNQVKVIPYEKEQFPNGIEKEFFDVVGVPLEQLHIPHQQNVNPGLGSAAVELINEFIHRKFPDDQAQRQKEIHRLKRFFANNRIGTKEVFKDYSLFSAEVRRKILEASADDNALIARKYLGREDGILFLNNTITDTTQEEDAQKLPLELLERCLALHEQTNRSVKASTDTVLSKLFRKLTNGRH